MRRVAVTGFGVVSPIGVGREAFFDALEGGCSGIAPLTRFDCGGFEVRLAGEVKQALGLPQPAVLAADEDPKVGYAVAACAEALAEAGVERLDSKTLLHLGVSLEIFHLEKIAGEGTPDVKKIARRCFRENETIQMPLDSANRVISDIFGPPGESLTNCSACAAGAQAIGHGFQMVRSGRCEVAVCGGFDSMINPLGVGGFQLLGALTVDNDRGESACRPFDASRTGTVLGEGAAVFVLEPLEAALAQGKTMLAEVCGYASTLDAFNLSAPDPKGSGAVRAMQGALDDAGIAPAKIGHINCHGTGTRLNDEIEAMAIRDVFENWETIPVSATKALTGHLIAAAGAVEAGALLLPLIRGMVPPNPFLNKPGRGCELNHATGTAFPFTGEYALTNSFGFGGQNACLILRKYYG